MLGFLLLALLVAFGSRIEEKGGYQHFIAIYGQQQSEGRETEAERGDGGRGRSKQQVPGSCGKKDSELGA